MSETAVITILQNYGPYALLMALFGWFIIAGLRKDEAYRKDLMQLMERHEKMLEAYRADTTRIMAQTAEFQRESRRMYENNATLVKNYESMAGDMRELLLLNASAIHTNTEAMKTNQYCPYVRLIKQAEGPRG